MKLPLAYYGHPVLRKKASPVQDIDGTIRQLVYDMDETMEANNGCGLAAPQVYHSLALFIVRLPQSTGNDEDTTLGPLEVFINPKIITYSQKKWACEEGCLSIPGIRQTVDRPTTITIEATDLEGCLFQKTFTEFNAHVIMHENDHLNGVLYIDRLTSKAKKQIENSLRQIKQKNKISP